MESEMSQVFAAKVQEKENRLRISETMLAEQHEAMKHDILQYQKFVDLNAHTHSLPSIYLSVSLSYTHLLTPSPTYRQLEQKKNELEVQKQEVHQMLQSRDRANTGKKEGKSMLSMKSLV